MADDDDLLTFIEGDEDQPAPEGRKWKVAVIDDSPAVHDGTRFALADYELNGGRLEFLSAHSAAEGRELLAHNPDVAVILLDVVMESDTAGLDLVGYIRRELKNDTVRIILRTGQPGQAPERQVIVDYDINDYKAKTELTADKLFTTMTAAIRSYEQLHRMAEMRRGLEIIVDAASTLYDLHSLQRLAEGVLTQISSVLGLDCAGILVLRDSGVDEERFSVVAGSGCYRDLAGLEQPADLAPDLRDLIHEAFARRSTQFLTDRSILYVLTSTGSEVVVLLEAPKPLSPTDRALVEIFCSRLPTAFDNVVLYEKLQQANSSLEKRVGQRTAELTAVNGRLESQWLRARRVNALQSEVLGTVAHDLKNPLGIILGRTEILTDLIPPTSPMSDQLKAQVQHIRESAKRLTGMVDTLVADVMTDALDITLRHEHFDVARLLQEVLDANRPLSERKRQMLSAEAPEPLLILGDYDRMRDALDNVISNAVKYSRIGGTIRVSAVRDVGRVAIRVEDSGPGLLPEDLSRLFGRFQRLSAKPTGGETSTGLGLSIAKRIVDLHGGTIAAENRPDGQGAVFTIALDGAPEPPP